MLTDLRARIFNRFTEDEDDEDGEPSEPVFLDYVMHFLTVFWKVGESAVVIFILFYSSGGGGGGRCLFGLLSKVSTLCCLINFE